MSAPAQPLKVRSMQPEDRAHIMTLARSLTQFFPEDVVGLIDTSLDKNDVLAGLMGDDVVAFLVYTKRDAQTAEIVWMGVKEDFHGLGLGSVILDNLEATLEEEGIRKLVASTLSYTVDYKPFEKVRTFYYNRGFQSLGIQNNYYDDGMDRLILVKDIY